MRLSDYAMESQREVIELFEDGHSRGKIAEMLGRDRRSVARTINRVELVAAKAGWSPQHDMTRTVPPGFSVKGVSTYYNGDGKPIGQWVKSQQDKHNPEEIIKFIQEAMQDYKSAAGKVACPKGTAKDRLVVYPMGDPHLGMYAWSAETGNDFDLDLACANLIEATTRLVDVAPATETAIILNLGDYFHADDQSNRTARSGHSLDVDTRWGKVYKAGIQAMIQCVDAARRKHKKVIVKNLIGNHDDHTSQTLAYALDAYFHSDKRVTVDTSPAKFWYYQFHKVLIGAGHGDTAKPDLLPNIMAADEPVMWGATSQRYWYTGHIHSQNVKEYAGVIWESFKTLAGKDAWHTAQGYRSGRDMFCIVHHKDYGEVERHRVDVSMLGGAK